MPYYRDRSLLHSQTRNGFLRNVAPTQQLSRTPHEHRIEALRSRNHGNGKFEVGNLFGAGIEWFFEVTWLLVMTTPTDNRQTAQIIRYNKPDLSQLSQQGRKMRGLAKLFGNGFHRKRKG
jgi:hypothetical protein